GLGLQILYRLSAFLEYFVFPEIELAPEIFALTLIHEGLIFRRAVVGRDLVCHAHSLRRATYARELRDSNKCAPRAGVIAAPQTPGKQNCVNGPTPHRK